MIGFKTESLDAYSHFVSFFFLLIILGIYSNEFAKSFQNNGFEKVHDTYEQIQVGVWSEDASIVATLIVFVGAASIQMTLEFFRVTEDLRGYDWCVIAQVL